MLATLTAALPDRVPVARRGALGGLIGISQMLGTMIGALLVTVLVAGLASGYLACGVLVVLAALTFALFTPDDVLPAALMPSGPCGPPWAGCRFRPAAVPTSAGPGSCTFLIDLGDALGTLYLLYFLQDGAHYHDPQTGLLILVAVSSIALAIASVVCGTTSDRSGFRRRCMVGAAVVMAVRARRCCWSARHPGAPR